MPVTRDYTIVVTMNVQINLQARELWVSVGQEGHGHDSFIVPFDQVRAVAAVLNAEIAANPGLFPLTSTRLVSDTRGM